MNKQAKIFLIAAALVVLLIFARMGYSGNSSEDLSDSSAVDKSTEIVNLEGTQTDVLRQGVEENGEVCKKKEERPKLIQQAFEQGDITERQRDILIVREEFRGVENSGSGMFEVLNERGFNITHEEMREIGVLMVDLEIGGGF